MLLRILHLNINGLNWKENVHTFLKRESFDILSLQEVAGKSTKIGNVNTQEDTVEEVQKMLASGFNSYVAPNNSITSSPTAYFGNATVIRNTLPVLHHEIIPLYQRTTPFPSDSHVFEEVSRSLLAIQIATETKPLWLLNTHLAWSPTPEDTEEKLRQGKIIIDFVASLKEPFLLTGDFNVDNNSHVIKDLEKYGRNLTREYAINNTLNKNVHKVFKEKPEGLAVDYIFVSPEIDVENFKVIEENLSDHLGLTATVSI